jgi:hypothetical protein
VAQPPSAVLFVFDIAFSCRWRSWAGVGGRVRFRQRSRREWFCPRPARCAPEAISFLSEYAFPKQPQLFRAFWRLHAWNTSSFGFNATDGLSLKSSRKDFDCLRSAALRAGLRRKEGFLSRCTARLRSAQVMPCYVSHRGCGISGIGIELVRFPPFRKKRERMGHPAVSFWQFGSWLLLLRFARHGPFWVVPSVFSEVLNSGFPAVGDLGQELADVFNFRECPGVNGSGSDLKNCRRGEFPSCNITGQGIKMDTQPFGCFQLFRPPPQGQPRDSSARSAPAARAYGSEEEAFLCFPGIYASARVARLGDMPGYLSAVPGCGTGASLAGEGGGACVPRFI